MTIRSLLVRPVLAVATLALASAALAEDAFYRVPLASIPGVQEALSGARRDTNWRRTRDRWQRMQPYGILEGDGEIYVSANAQPGVTSPPMRGTAAGSSSDEVLIRCRQARDVKGRIVVPNPDWSGMATVAFSLPASAASPDARDAFYRAKQQYYEHLSSLGIPGGAWFRHQARTARLALKITPAADANANMAWQSGRTNELVETYELFSGGRAMSENLQLDRVLPRVQANETPVDPKTLGGITIQEIDWQPLLKDAKPRLDPLAAVIPADQHAVFFTSFQAAVALADETKAHDTPVLHMALPRSENTRVVERYQEQLGLPMSQLARLVGPHVAKSVALTGSDPFFPTGTDLAVLFEAPQPGVLENLLMVRIGLAAGKHKDAKLEQGEVAGLAYRGARSPDRVVSSYVAKLDGAVVVTNSLHQLKRMAEVRKGETKPIASLPEYAFFRNRYKLGDADETAFLFLSDPTIRRWCGPHWRIADSRRTRVAAVLAELQASQLDKLVRGQAQPGPIHTDLPVPEAGELTLGPAGVTSAAYGSLGFMTPIAEIPLETVTRTEAEAYGRWRDGYQRNWSWAFDPIAVRISLGQKSLSADMTVMPLIANTRYRQFISISQGASIPPGAGDRHDAMAHFMIALNHKSPMFQQADTVASGVSKGLSLGWIGRTAEIYADADPFWKDLGNQKPDDMDRFMQQSLNRLPVAVRVESTSSLRLAAFLAGLRAFVEQTAPGLTRWETLTYRDHPYVKITATDRERGLPAELRNIAIYYAALPDSLTVTLNENVIKQALERDAVRAKAKSAGKAAAEAGAGIAAVSGGNVALHVDREVLEIANRLSRDEYQAAMQASAWGNLSILNQWKQRYPDHDPLEVHRRVWNTELVCPGGGKYVWNEKYATMESTVYGHPGEPKQGPPAPPVLSSFRSAAFGLTFEPQGLRARAALERDQKNKAPTVAP